MKKTSTIITTVIFLVFTGINSMAQISFGTKDVLIDPYRLMVTCYKTTNLVFPYAIKSVDRGSNDILAQKAKGIENILQVKAGRKDFPETNLSVVTADGKLYSYVLNYADSPSVLNLQFTAAHLIGPDALFSQATNEAVIEANAKIANGRIRTLYGIQERKYAISMGVNGLFIHDDVFYCQVKIRNTSNISYDISQLRLFIKDKRKSKRTATQELELKPLYVYNNTTKVLGKSEHVMVFALPKFTIPDQKYFFIQMAEKEGGRNLQLKLDNRDIVQAKTL